MNLKGRKTNNLELITLIDQEKLPVHVAIIMDGNGRWAAKHNFGRIRGHRAGVKSIRAVTKYSAKLGIKYLTLYAFSTENWNRPVNEVNALWKLLFEFLDKELPLLLKRNIKLNAIGKISKIPKFTLDKLNSTVKKTEHCTGLNLILAINYGSRDEIVDAVSNIIKKNLHLKKGIDSKLISDNLYTKNIPDPDFLIRTSGEKRISNFLLWQLSYAELYFTNTLWPDFNEEEYLKALLEFQKRDRRFGGI